MTTGRRRKTSSSSTRQHYKTCKKAIMDFDSDRVTVVNTNPNFTGAAPVVDESLFEKERARNSFRYVCFNGWMVGRGGRN